MVPPISSKKDGEEKETLLRLCDKECVFPPSWPSTLLRCLQDIVYATPASYLNLPRLIKALDKVETCGKCYREAGTDTEAVVPVLGNGCHPPEHCLDLLRWLRLSVSPHFPKLRTLLRQLYKLRERTRDVAELEEAIARVDLKALETLIGVEGESGKETSVQETKQEALTEFQLQEKLAFVFSAFQDTMDDFPNRMCSVCEERKSLSDLVARPVGQGRRKKGAAPDIKDAMGTPLIHVSADPNLTLAAPYFHFMGLDKTPICRKCYDKLRKQGAVWSSDAIAAYHQFLTRVRAFWNAELAESEEAPEMVEMREDNLMPCFPMLSIFNGCVLEPIPDELKAVMEQGPYTLNLCKLVRVFHSVTYLKPVAFSGSGMPALSGHSIYFTMPMNANSEYIRQKCSLPNFEWDSLVIQNLSRKNKAVFNNLIDRATVSRLIDFLIAHNVFYQRAGVRNSWTVEVLEDMEFEERMEEAGLASPALASDSEDEAEEAAPLHAPFTRHRLRIRQFHQPDEDDTDDPDTHPRSQLPEQPGTEDMEEEEEVQETRPVPQPHPSSSPPPPSRVVHVDILSYPEEEPNPPLRTNQTPTDWDQSSPTVTCYSAPPRDQPRVAFVQAHVGARLDEGDIMDAGAIEEAETCGDDARTGEEEDGDGEARTEIAAPKPPLTDEKISLRHLGAATKLPITATAVLDKAFSNPRTDLQVFENTRVEAAPLSSWDPEMETKAHPECYPRGRFGFSSEDRPALLGKLHEGAFVKHQLLRLDSRFSSNLEYLLAALNRKRNRQVMARIFLMVHARAWTKKGSFPTANEILNDIRTATKREDVDAKLNSILMSVTGSPSYWSVRRQQLEAMVDAHGSASLFVTLSQAGYPHFISRV